MNYHLIWDRTHHGVGIDVIDGEHRELVERVNRLADAVRRGQNDKVERLLDELIEFTGLHFTHEESLMSEHGFPGLEKHKAEHDTLLRLVRNLKQERQSGRQTEQSALIAAFVADWAEGHIVSADKELGEFLAGKALR